MPIDKPEATADTVSRRAFISRSAIGAAVVGSGVLAGFGRFGPAGAQAGPDQGGGALDDDAFGRFMVPLELGAVQAYQTALDSGQLAGFETEARRFQSHHNQIATSLGDLIVAGDDDPAPAPDPTVAASGAGGPAALAEMEAVLAATHILAIEQITDTVTARQSAQVAAVQSQQSASLALRAEMDPAAVTPAVISLDNARQVGAAAAPIGTDAADGETQDGTEEPTVADDDLNPDATTTDDTPTDDDATPAN